MNPTAFNFRQQVTFALAECRGAWRRFIFFLICIAIGVGAVMTINSFSLLLDNAIRAESKGLLAADIEIKGSWGQSQKDIAFQKTALPPGTEFMVLKELAIDLHLGQGVQRRRRLV